MDSAENLRCSTVPSSKRLAIICSNLNTKFSLHLQGGSRRVERTGNRVIGEMVSSFTSSLCSPPLTPFYCRVLAAKGLLW